MKTLILSVLASIPLLVSAQDSAPEADKAVLAQYLAPGHKMALDSYLALGGEIRSLYGKSEVYTAGPIKGLRKEEAIAKFEKTWAASSAAVRMGWAKKAMMAGKTIEVMQNEEAAKADEDAAKAAEEEAKRQRMAEMMRMSRLRDIERKVDDIERGKK